MPLLEIVTKTLVGSRGGLGFLAFMGLVACLSSDRPASAISRWRKRLFTTFSAAVFLFQFPRLAWLLGKPHELPARLVDLTAVLLTAAVLVGAIAVFAIERGAGAERVKRAMAVNVLVFDAMVCAGWYFR